MKIKLLHTKPKQSMKHLFFIIIGILLLPSLSLATSGACSYHGGVNCDASSNGGYAVCNDGWSDSTVRYSEMSECSTDTSFSLMMYYMDLTRAACPNTTYSFLLTAEKNQQYEGVGYERLADCLEQNRDNDSYSSATSLVSACGGLVQIDTDNSYKKAYEEISAQCLANTTVSNQTICGKNSHAVDTMCRCNEGYVWANTDPNNTDCILGITNTNGTTNDVFTDIDIFTNYYQAIKYLKEEGIINGYSDGSFKPNNKINRAEFTKIVVNSVYPNATGINCFPDVKDDWYAPYVCTAKRLEIISGYTDGTFKPNNNINAAEALKITLNAYNIYIPETDAEWYLKYFTYGIANNINVPSWGTALQEITRAEMAQLIHNLEMNQ